MADLHKKYSKVCRINKIEFILKKLKRNEKPMRNIKKKLRNRLQKIEQIKLLLEKPKSNISKRVKTEIDLQIDHQITLVQEGKQSKLSEKMNKDII